MPEVTAGRVCLSLVAAVLGPSPYIADWNKTHIFNSKWPPHAKFHNGQTMSFGPLLALPMLYYTWRSSPTAKLDSIRTAAIFGSIYWLAGLSAWFYPGSLAVDPEFGTGFPQLPLFVTLTGLSWLGYWLEARRLAGLKKA